MLTPQQRDAFFQQGFLRLQNLMPRDLVARMVDRIWAVLEERKGMVRHDPTTWIEGGVRGIGDINRESIFRPFGTPQLTSLINDLLGTTNWQQPSSWGQILVTFPAATWSWNSLFQGQVEVDTISWHTDYPYDTPQDQLSGVQVFCLLADLESGGGGTLVMQGSHRLIQQFVRKQSAHTLQKMKRARLALLGSDPWFASVSQAISLPRPEPWFAEQQGIVDGVAVSVTELTGKAGDVYLTHPWLLHAISPNCNPVPRMMCTQRIHGS